MVGLTIKWITLTIRVYSVIKFLCQWAYLISLSSDVSCALALFFLPIFLLVAPFSRATHNTLLHTCQVHYCGKQFVFIISTVNLHICTIHQQCKANQFLLWISMNETYVPFTALTGWLTVNFRERDICTIHQQCGANQFLSRVSVNETYVPFTNSERLTSFFRERDVRTIHQQCGVNRLCSVNFCKRDACTISDHSGARSGLPQLLAASFGELAVIKYCNIAKSETLEPSLQWNTRVH